MASLCFLFLRRCGASQCFLIFGNALRQPCRIGVDGEGVRGRKMTVTLDGQAHPAA